MQMCKLIRTLIDIFKKREKKTNHKLKAYESQTSLNSIAKTLQYFYFSSFISD